MTAGLREEMPWMFWCVVAAAVIFLIGRAIRFSTLTALCDVLECKPGELFTIEDHEAATVTTD